MMKKRIVPFVLAICILTSLTVAINAVDMRASSYLVAYSSTLAAKGGGNMATSIAVWGVDTMTKIGVQTIKIEEKCSATGSWHYYDTLKDTDDLDAFYDYGVSTFLNTFYFEGTPGYYYRVTATVYAGNKNGSDTGKTTSPETLCK